MRYIKLLKKRKEMKSLNHSRAKKVKIVEGEEVYYGSRDYKVIKILVDFNYLQDL